MNYYFINDEIKQEIRTNVINRVFPNLNINHQTLLFTLLLDIIDTVAIKFNFDLNKSRDLYEHQLRQNNYQDLRGLLLMLLPFINDEDGSKKTKLKDLNDIFLKKKTASQYIYSNIQYDRCKRTQGQIQEVKFDTEYLMHNYFLLKETINQVANKLFVNWIDVRPLLRVPLEQADSVELIKNTQQLLNEHALAEWDFYKRQQQQLSGLSINDIYDVISNELYYMIKKIKWTIFDVATGNNNTVLPLLVILADILDISNTLNGIDYNKLTVASRQQFDESWRVLIEAVETNKPIEQVLKVLMIFFDMNYTDVEQIAKEEGYVRLKTVIVIEDEDDLEGEGEGAGADDDAQIKKVNISKQMVIRSAKTLRPEHIYNFINHDLTILKRSYYGKLMLDRQTTDTNNTNYTVSKNITLYNKLDVQYKNLYNFAKAIVHNFKIKGKSIKDKQYAKFWKMLTETERREITTRLNWDVSNKSVLEWFNIMRNLKKYMGLSEDEAVKKNNDIFKIIQDNLAFIVYDVLASKGVLSQFTPNRNMSDGQRLPKNDIERKKYMKDQLKNIKSNANFGDAYYFLTGEMYKNLEVTTDKGTFPYLDFLTDNMADGWITTYAMNWVSQIAFFHHYYNNRVFFITGSTGVGKSTQIPKLFLYALKMVDYKDSGKIICSQPRIRPTEQNSDTISREMGTPIFEYNSDRRSEIESKNYYVQFKHNENSHTLDTASLMLRVVTDGTLLQEVNKNPVLKRQRKNGNYTQQNIYDIVIVDETHEHNYNMDFILTLMKYTAYYNNDVKLVLISATMDEDEPIYRRFYREINDNRMYPFNRLLSKYNLDRINVDRRLHISPPGASTRSKITDVYLPDADPEELVSKIARESKQAGNTRGEDILLFKPGQREITDAVAKLNTTLPADMIALPYYSKMPNAKKDFIEKLDRNNNIYNLTTPKSASFTEETATTTSRPVPKGTYKRAVIVATNIAEASITITTLRSVVDTGMQRTDEYNYQIRSSTLVTSTISETSRVQRRGRVGRVAPGTVYYIYKFGAMENNRIQYKISTSDISENLISLLQDSPDESPLIPPQVNPNKTNTTALNTSTVTSVLKNGLDKMILAQYFDKNKFIAYFGNPNHYDYENDTPPHQYYQTGYSFDSLNDEYGTFYIIHPDELCFFRNIIGTIVEVIKSSICNITLTGNKIISKKMQSFWEMLRDRFFVFATNTAVVKTTYGVNILQLKQKLDLEDSKDLSLIVAYVYSRKYNVDQDLLKLIPMFGILNGSIKTLIAGELIDNKYIVKIKELQNLYNEHYGDSCVLIKIIDAIFTYIHKLNVYKTGIKSELFLKEQKAIYISGKYSSVDPKLLKTFDKLTSSGKLEVSTQDLSKAELTSLKTFNTKVELDTQQLDKHEKDFERWCTDHYLNYSVVRKYITQYVRFLNKFQAVDTELIEWFDSHLETITKIVPDTDNTRCMKIIASLLHGYNFNIAKRVGTTNFYILISYPDPKYVYNISEITHDLHDTALVEFGDYIMFLNKSEYGLSLLHNVNPKLIQEIASNIYTAEKFSTAVYSGENSKKMIRHLISLFDTDKKYVNSGLENSYAKTIEDIRMDMVNSYNPRIWYSYAKLHDSKMYRNSIERGPEQKIQPVQIGGHIDYNYKNVNNPFIMHIYELALKKVDKKRAHKITTTTT